MCQGKKCRINGDMTLRLPPVLALLLILAACGGDDDDGPGADGSVGADAPAGADGGGGGAALDELVGPHPALITVAIRGDGQGTVFSTAIVAELRQAAAPTPYTEAQREGACLRLTSEVPFCDPACGADALCTADDTCTPVPALESAGPLTLAVGAATRTVTPAGSIYATSEETELFPGGSTLTASAPGDVFPAFELSTAVPEPLTGVSPPGVLVAGSPYRVTWTPGDPGTRVFLRLIADRGHNPVHPSVIYCDAADEAGVIDVPVALIDPHVDGANWSCGDCFPSEVTRYRTATVAAGGVGGSAVRLSVATRADVYAGRGR